MGHPYLEGRDAALALAVGDQAHAAHIYARRHGYQPGTPERQAFCAGFYDHKPALALDAKGRITAVYTKEQG